MDTPSPSSSPKSCCEPGCCSTPRAEQVRAKVREGYSKIAEAGSWSAAAPASACFGSSKSSGGGCCGPSDFSPAQLAQAIGYARADISGAAQEANLGLSCGNPFTVAAIKPGETVLDLGSGAGFDAFIAGPKVGATGRVIGVDMTPAMIAKARVNLQHYTTQTGLSNVEFRLGEIEQIPASDESIEVVISNCVLNLSPDQPRVWREIARVLKTAGRVAISDLVLLRPLPASVRSDVEALVGCVAGASLIAAVEEMARRAGLTDISIERKSGYVDAMTDWRDPLYQKIIAALQPGEKIGDYVISAIITARKA